MHLNDKVVLVTGGSRGIGASVVRQLAQDGYSIAVNYHQSEKKAYLLNQELSSKGCKCIEIKADVSKLAEVENMFLKIEAELGKVDILINNAGISSRGLVTDISEAEWDRVLGINLKGAFLCARRALPSMINQRWGRIINIASVWGITGAAYESLYATSKGGLITFTKSLAKELGPSGITVNAVAPGPIETDMLNSEIDKGEKDTLVEGIPLGRLGRPEDIASICSYLVSPRATYITGQVITVDGGFIS